MAEEEGFEPPVLAHCGFQDRRLRPLGHSSMLSKNGSRLLAMKWSDRCQEVLSELFRHPLVEHFFVLRPPRLDLLEDGLLDLAADEGDFDLNGEFIMEQGVASLFLDTQ